MCDPETFESDLPPEAFSRRQLGTLAAGAGLAWALPASASERSTAERAVTVTTPDGQADGWLVHPSSGRHPAVLLWPDILSLRPAMRDLGRRLASAGYAVLVVNPFYRRVAAPVVPDGSSFTDPAVRAVVVPLMQSLTPTTHTTDAAAFLDWMDAQPEVDPARPAGTLGYCMGGQIALRTAAVRPERVAAAASFHGGGLVTDSADSPHLLLPKLKASLLIAIATNDDQREPKAKDTLREAAAAAGRSAEIEVYPAAHGWCAPDSPAFDAEQASRAWGRLLVLFEGALA